MHTHRDELGPYSYCFACGDLYRDGAPCGCRGIIRNQPMPLDLIYDDMPLCNQCGEPIDNDEDDGVCTTCWEQELGEDDSLWDDWGREQDEQDKRDSYDDMFGGDL